ncbi:MAG: glycoside hydrolase family 31 protein [Lachnospiraceae bacterium]|nr:glycoside hydrolase family 31 protein [Lachnospiraceae bacterium]
MIKQVGKITRIVCTPDGTIHKPGMTIASKKDWDTLCLKPEANREKVAFASGDKALVEQKQFAFEPRAIYEYCIEGKKAKMVTKKTIDGERTFIENAATVKTGDAYTATVCFQIRKDTCIYGLGQHENGIYNYRNVKEYLYQNNMKIPMPVFLSSDGYAILFDADCLMTYEERDNEIHVVLDAVDQISYYLIVGDTFDELIAGIRTLTGKAAMLPRWAFGYVQSKERYVSQEDILTTSKEFKKRQIPLSCLVLDWKSWEEGKWGNKIVDKERFGNLKAMTDQLHEDDTAFMVSIWPNMNKGCENNAQMMEGGYLLANLSTYNAFDEQARALYFKQCKEELFSGGVDAWWCDSTEPFTPDWNGLEKREEEERYALAKENLTRYFDARKANNYALAHAKGIYENQMADTKEKRVVNLTRSGSLSIQQYGTILWSGDIMATWDVFRHQIAEGLSMCMSGIPYWTLDIGAFFAGSTKGFRRFTNASEGEAPWFWHGLFEDGVADKGYKELYTRWLQFGTFLPVMRSHGTDTPREPWNFGEPGSIYYDTIVKYINMRYEMLPYSYSLAYQMHEKSYTLMRSLMFDFASDEKVRNIADEFMYGPSYLVAPVTNAMEFGPDNEQLEGITTQKVYLPNGTGWYHQENKQWFEGGRAYEIDAPIAWQPVFIREGAILPLSKARTKDGVADTIEIYEGADGTFTYYLDNGMDDAYQRGEFAKITMHYEDKARRLVLDAAEGTYAYPEHFTCIYWTKDGKCSKQEICYNGNKIETTL